MKNSQMSQEEKAKFYKRKHGEVYILTREKETCKMWSRGWNLNISPNSWRI